ncbi:hypothetical protein [Nocardiopsis valliformis]|uniref:hypothetical protein n=1 Tax=Nocardiopsis valliformis TaxID=239974 RepID=UPI0003457960|nr:hypothetical protein [Nocardiopsis valliformis]
MSENTTPTGPITQTDLDEITTVAELASSQYRVVSSRALCRSGAVLRIGNDYRQAALALIQAAGYTARVVANSIVVTGAVDRLTLLEAQLTELTAQRDALVDARRASELEDAAFVPTLAPEGAR